MSEQRIVRLRSGAASSQPCKVRFQRGPRRVTKNVTLKTLAKKTRSKKTLNAANLEALGTERLTAILLAVADEQPATKRRLRMELAAEVNHLLI